MTLGPGRDSRFDHSHAVGAHDFRTVIYSRPKQTKPNTARKVLSMRRVVGPNRNS